MKNIKLRWYQVEAIAACIDYLEENPGKHPLIVCPTGSGKSVIIAKIAEVIERIQEREPDAVILVVSHVKEIIDQDAKALEALLPGRVGVYSSGMKRKERKSITVAGVQSIYRKPYLFRKATHIIVDEAHLIPPDGEGMYQTLFEELCNAVVIGLTATPFRLGSGYLHTGNKRLFDELVYEVDIVKLIQQGYLSPLLTKGSTQELSVEGITTVAGEFNTKQMEETFDKFEKTNAIVEEMVQYKETRKSWLVFAIGISHAEHIAEELNKHGVIAKAVHSKLSGEVRDRYVRQFKAGHIQALVSVATLTTGFDHPAVDMIALVRPTNSPVLHVQMIGRGLRIAEEKENCLVLDFAGNIMRLGPINDVHIAEKGKKKGVAPIKTCPSCQTHVPASARACYICGHEFKIDTEKKLTTQAHEVEAIKTSKGPSSAWHDVTQVLYTKHFGAKGTSLKVTYRCGMRMFNEWLAIGRGGRGGYMADHWWTYRSRFAKHPEYWPPTDVDIALKRIKRGELNEPTRILVEEDGKYPRIERSEFGVPEQIAASGS